MAKAFFQRLDRDQQGVGFVELALVAPLIALLFLGMTDLSKVISTRVDLEQAAQRTTDFALAKRPPNGDTTYLVNEAKNASGVTDSNNITVKLLLECDGTAQPSFTAQCAPGQITARFANVAIRKTVATGFNWRAIAAMFGGSSAEYRPVTVTGDSVVRLQ